MHIGVISDTHGRLPREVFDHFKDVERILHAGDIGPLTLLADLEAIAPVTAVWGNTDGPELRARLGEIERVELEGRILIVVHGHQLGSPTPRGLRYAHPDADVVVFGHSHRPTLQHIEGHAFLNPGSAGAPRFGLPRSIALLDITAAAIEARIIML
jgi:putative phosphoesterase